MDEEKEALIDEAEALCRKFVAKVEDGRAISRETYADCKTWLAHFEEYMKG